MFEAFELDERGEKKGSAVVLKDIWIDNDRTREGAILAQLYDEADAGDKELLKKHFLTTVCHGDVCIGPNVDDTGNGLMRGLSRDKCNLFQLQKESVQRIHREGEGPSGSRGLRATSRLHGQRPAVTYMHKTHYRIVFEEKGVPIDEVRKLGDVMKGLADIVIGTFSPVLA